MNKCSSYFCFLSKTIRFRRKGPPWSVQSLIIVAFLLLVTLATMILTLMACVNAPKDDKIDVCEKEWHLKLFLICQFIVYFVFFFSLPFLAIHYTENRRDRAVLTCTKFILFTELVYCTTIILVSNLAYSKEELQKSNFTIHKNETSNCFDVYNTTPENSHSLFTTKNIVSDIYFYIICVFFVIFVFRKLISCFFSNEIRKIEFTKEMLELEDQDFSENYAYK